MDSNAIINVLLISLTAFLSGSYSLWFVLTPIAVHALNDFLSWKTGWNLFNTDIMVKRAYESAHDFLINQTGTGLDLGFNFYDGDLTRNRVNAQRIKWDFMLTQLKLKPGHKLIDIGCGYGDWIRYAKEKGILVKGVNITPCQVKLAKEKYGLDVLNMNWKDILKNPSLQKELYGQFDVVTFMDTIEHYVPASARHNIELQKKIYSDMFSLASYLIKPDSKSGRVFFSCLHQTRKKWSFLELASIWAMNRTLSGFYPIGDDGLTRYATDAFNEVNRVDKTEDYRLTGVLENEHFQTNNNFPINFKAILNGVKYLLIDPYFIHRLISLALDHWMRLYGEDWHEKKYNPDKRAKVSTVRLWMVTLEKKKKSMETQPAG